MIDLTNPQAAIAWLQTPQAIRSRCEQIFTAAQADALKHFALQPKQLKVAADYVIATIKTNYPDLNIPYHSRWRHFAVGGIDRWDDFADSIFVTPRERVRMRVELAIVSVLLDAGAGNSWNYRDSDSGQRYSRSEGLALASFHMYSNGLFSNKTDTPRVDAAALAKITERKLGQAFQASPANPLVGLTGRVELLHRLGEQLQAQPQFFGKDARLGNLYDYLSEQTQQYQLPAANILSTVLQSLGEIWPSRLQLDGVNLGDVWHHSAIRTDDLTDGLVPFHKLSQWLSYSLVEPLEEAGIQVTDLDELTGLPEYRNGGLFIDHQVLLPKRDYVMKDIHSVDSEVVVEWRALTVCLLDRLAKIIRIKLGKDEKQLPLAKILEGGSWSAGRRIARERRTDGSPPLQISSDGTVF